MASSKRNRARNFTFCRLPQFCGFARLLRINYDAFGNLLNSTGSTPNDMRYRGEQWDSDLGLYYLRARYYNPITGRFMSRDPYDGNTILPISLHKYLYASGNPVNRIDPRGRADLFEYSIESNAAVPEAKLLSIYGCVAGASLGVPGKFCTSWTERNWYRRSDGWARRRSTHLNRL